MVIDPQKLPTVIHSFSTWVIQNLWTTDVDKCVGNMGMSGGQAVENLGKLS